MASVLVLDLTVRGSGFLGDGGLARLAERLVQAGHAVAQVDAVWPEESAAHVRPKWRRYRLIRPAFAGIPPAMTYVNLIARLVATLNRRS